MIKEKIYEYLMRLREKGHRRLIDEMLWVYRYARLYRRQMLLYTALGLIGTAVSLLSSLVSRDMVDIITGHETGLLVRTFAIFIGLNVGNIFLNQTSAYFSNRISISVDNAIKADVFDQMLITDLESLQKYHTGDLLTRWSNDASTISGGILNWIPNLVIYTVRLISTFLMVFYHDPWFALIAMIGMPVSILTTRHMLERMRRTNKSVAAMNAKMTGFNQETFSNIQTIKAFDMIRLYSRHLRGLQEEYLDMRMTFQRLSLTASAVMSLAGLAISYSCYAFGIYRVWSGAITYGTMTMFLGLAGSLSTTLNQMISLIPTAVGISVAAGRLIDIMEMPKESFAAGKIVDEFWEKNRDAGIHMHLVDLTYSYRSGRKVFSHAEFEAHPHETVALIGPSGEGKTTLLRIMLSLLHPQSGRAYVYGSATPEMLKLIPSTRRLFSYVPQGNTMFSGTIAENMRNVKEDATDEEITDALKMACAWEFIEKLPDGIHSVIGERGKNFSEGQAQRLSIARALLRRSPILLLDEATSALDTATEEALLKNIMRDDYPRTCIVTTHRTSVLGICHRVYEIKNKQCVPVDAGRPGKRGGASS